MAGAAMLMRRSGVLLALLTLTLMVSQASDVPFPPSSDAPAGLLVARSATKVVVSQASGLAVPSPSTSDAPAGLHAARSAAKEEKAVVSQASGQASGLAVSSPPTSDDAPAGLASKEGEAVVPPGEKPPSHIHMDSANAFSGAHDAETGPTPKTDRVVLMLANTFSLGLSLSPFVLRLVYGSWYITRTIFPAKGVAINFIASGAWTVYVILEMYAANNYAGLEALMVNCLTMGTNLVTLIVYFLHSKEVKKFFISSVIFLILSWGGLVWLICHPNTIHSNSRKLILRNHTQLFGIIGMILFIIMNGFPFLDLLAVKRGGRNDVFTLIFPILINNFTNVVAGSLWTVYAGLFGRNPNYFMYANILATAMTFIQTMLIAYLRFKHKEVDGLITEVEILRSVMISVSSSLGRLGEAPDYLWNQNRFIMRLHQSLKTGVLSLVAMESALRRLQADLNASLQVPDVAVQPYALAALGQYPVLLEACQGAIDTVDAFVRAITDKLSGLPPPQQIHEMDVLKICATNASEAMTRFAECLRPSMQLINTAQGIPFTAQFAFELCREQLFVIENAAGHFCLLRLPCAHAA